MYWANVHSLLGFFDDLEFCFDSAGVHDDDEKKQHAVRYAPDSEKTIWRAFPEFATAAGDYIGGSLFFLIHDLTSLVATTAKTNITSIKAFGEYSRKFRDIATSLVSSGYLRNHERDHLFLQDIEDSLRQEVVQHLRISHPAVLYPRQQYSIEQQSELVDITQALKAATTAFAQLQRHAPLALGCTTQELPTIMPLHQPVSRVSASPTLTVPTRLAAAHPRPTALAPSYRGIAPGFHYEKRLAE
ncbi:hypothetical protein LXA43DRAFT_1099959 [Ganoderma leucocontextum]|nr:hypothetical protein LXA43DRAFT_1099959 [Ganoderma leucocontextum]